MEEHEIHYGMHYRHFFPSMTIPLLVGSQGAGCTKEGVHDGRGGG